MQPGFFTSSEIKNVSPIGQKHGCAACSLYKQCLSPKMEATGEGQKGILAIAEAPGSEEDERNKQLVGKIGQYLRRKLLQRGIDLDVDCRKINAINCRPPENRKPTDNEIICCRSRVWAEIEQMKPRAILLLGGSAIKSFLGHRWKKDLGAISKWRGWTIPDRDTGAWVFPTFHPSYIERSADNPAVEKIFDMDLDRFAASYNDDFPQFAPEENRVEILYSERELYQRLQMLLEFPQEIAIDFETTGLKPHAPGHKIITCAFAFGTGAAIAFPMPSGRTREMLKKVFADEKIAKVAHNLQFENNWSSVFLGTEIKGWVWDTMLMSHVLDNRQGVTGLKFQAYVNFGRVDYDSHLEKYIQNAPEKKKKGSNAINLIESAPLEDILLYNGMDVIFTMGLKQKQRAHLQTQRFLNRK